MGRQKYWECYGKTPDGERCGCCIPVGRAWCNGCGNQPPAHITSPPNAKGGQGSKGPKPPKGGGKGSGAPAKDPKGGGKGGGASAKEAKQSKEIVDLKRQLEEAKKAQPPAAGQQCENQTGSGTKECGTEVEALNKEISRTRETAEFMEAQGYHEEAEKYSALCEEAKAKKTAAKPFGLQLRDAERKANSAKKAEENNGKELAKLREESQALEAKVKETEALGRELANTAAQRMEEFKSLLQKQSVEFSSEGLGHQSDATEAAAKEIRRLAKSLPPTVAPQFAHGLQEVVAFIGQISAAAHSWETEFPQVGHRPPGTERACEDLEVEARACQSAQAVPFFVGMPTEVHNAFQALVEMDVESDEESEAPTESGEEARTAKRVKKAARRAAKNEKLTVCRKVWAKFGKSPG